MSLNTLFKYWTYQVIAPGTLLREKYEAFKDLLLKDRTAHDCMAELEEIFYCKKLCDFSRVCALASRLCDSVGDMVHDLEVMSPMDHVSLKDYFKKINFYIRFMLAPPDYDFSPPFAIMPNDVEDLSIEELAGKAGGKGANLITLSRKLGLPVPDFFIVSTSAFYYFLEYNDLNGKITLLLSEIDLSRPDTLEENSRKLTDLIKSAHLPDDIAEAIRESASKIAGDSLKSFSVRSSAVAEDSQNSFAGQYLTRLNIPAEKLCEAYIDVIASKYSPSAITYRIMRGLTDIETPMAVVVQAMINPEAAGIVYTQDPEGSGLIVVHAVPGLGETAVDGEVSPDRFYIDRKKPHEVKMRKPGTKAFMLVCKDAGTITGEKLTVDERNRLCIGDETARQLASWGCKAEEFFLSPQDMEWCLEKEMGLLSLQTRPLGQGEMREDTSAEPVTDTPPLLKGTVTASPGRISGKAFVIKKKEHLSKVPENAIIVARTIPPSYAALFSRIAGIISEEAVSASHAATVAREAGIPFLSGVSEASTALATGQTITVDATGMKVYDGEVKELLEGSSSPSHCIDEDSPFYERLKYIMGFILQLNLIDHESPDFKPENCRTIHDILRFCHEKAMQEMFSLGDRKRGSARGAKRLVVDIPISFYVIDAGGGTRNPSLKRKELTMDDVVSRPMKLIWKGLSDPAISWDQGEHFDWAEYDSVVLGGGVISKDSPSLASYAIISSDYMNLSIRFGYHFVVIDALVTDNAHSNYITFRFSGGGGDDQGRFLRAKLLKLVLEELGFEVSLKGELIDAIFRQGSSEKMEELLPVLGRLLGATRLMDMRLSEFDDIKALADQFMKGRCDFVSAGSA